MLSNKIKLSLFLIISLLILHLPVLVATEPLTLNELLIKGDYYLSFADYQEAEAFYKEAMLRDNTDLRAIEGLLYSLTMQQKFTEIITIFADIGVKPVSVRLYDAYARYMTGDYIGSLNAYKRIVRIDTDNDTALAGLGWNYADLGYYTYALKMFAQALEIDATYYSAGEGVSFADNMRNYLYSQLSWLDKKEIKANPSMLTYLSLNSYNFYLLYDFFAKEIDIDEDFLRSSLTGGFRYFYDRFIFGTNLYYLTSSEQTMYDAKGILIAVQSHFLLPCFLLDLGVSGGMSEYKFGRTAQYELYGNLHFNTLSLRPAFMIIELNEKEDIRLVDEAVKSVVSLGMDYYFNPELTIKSSISIGEKMLMMNKNGYITDKYTELPTWEIDLSLLLKKDAYLFYLGSKYDELDTLTIYGGVGATLNIKR